MKIIEKYLIFEWFKWFLLSFLVLYSLLFIQFLNEENKLLGNGRLFPVLSLFAYKAIAYLTWLFPIVCFISTLFTFSLLAKNRELLALFSTGFSSFSISRPIVILALLCSVVSWFFQDSGKIIDWLQDHSGEQNLSDRIGSSFKMRLQTVNRTWYLDNYDTRNGFAEQIHLYCYDDEGNDLYRIRAQSGQKTKNGWKFNKGIFLGFFSVKGIPVINKNNQLSWDSFMGRNDKFHSKNVNVPSYQKEFKEIELPNINDDPEPFALLRVSPKDLNYGDLSEIIESFPDPNAPQLFAYQLRRAQLFWNVPSCLVFVFFALGLTLRRVQLSIGVIIGSSLIWILIFYVIKSFCDILGETGIFSAWIVTLIPFLIIFIASICMLLRNR